jgi:hypothetical protein
MRLHSGVLLLTIAFAAPAAMAGDYKSNSSAPAPIQVVNNQGSDAERSACTPDVFRLCGQHIPDATAIVGCLKLQRAHLSPACRAVFR